MGSISTRLYWSVIGIIFVCGLVVAPGRVCAGDNYTPRYDPSLKVPLREGNIKIDGILTDAGWRNAGRAAGFAEHKPGDQTEPPVETEAFITYDAENLYVAFVCHDDPSTIRSSMCDRENISNDDNICLLIDTYGNADWAYEFNVNPYGIQSDQMWTRSGGEDGGFDVIWESAGKVTDSGYQIEMAVPFSSLRFPNTPEQTWKVDFWRNHPRDIRRQYSWAAYDRNDPCWPCQWGTVTGIANVQPGKGIELLPSMIAYQSGSLAGSGTPQEPYDFQNADPDGELSLGTKYSITSSAVAELTYNPDFSQVEADAAQVDVNTTLALFYSERRPFFQEGSDLFRTWTNAVYTRSINDPQVAGKFTFRNDRTSVAYLGARDEHSPIILPFEEGSAFLVGEKSTSNILRVRRAFGKESYAGLLLTDRRMDGGGSGTVLSADGEFCLSRNFRFQWQAFGTHTREPNNAELNDQIGGYVAAKYFDSTFDGGKHTSYLDGESYYGHALITNIEERSRNFDFDINYIEYSPTFRLDNGFQAQNDRRQVEAVFEYTFFYEDGFVERINPGIGFGRAWNFRGERKDEWAYLEGEIMLKGQVSIHPRVLRSAETYHGIYFDNIWYLHTCGHTQLSDMLGFQASINYNNIIARRENPPVMGRETSVYFGVEFKPIDRLLFEPTITYSHGKEVGTDRELYDGYIFWSRVSLQLTRRLAFRLVTQYDDFYQTWDVDPLLTYRINSFSMAYAGTTYDYGQVTEYPGDGTTVNSMRMASRQFFVKVQYLLQL